MASLDARLKRLEEASIQWEVDRAMERWEPVRKALGITDDLLPFLRQHKEEFIRWQRDNAPVTEEMLEQETRRLAERTAAEFGVTVEEIYAGAERIARIMEEFGVE